MHYTFCVSVRNNWDKYVRFYKNKIAKSVTLYLVPSVLLEYIWKMINGSHRWTKRLYRKIYNDCFKEKKLITKYIRFFISLSYFWGRKKITGIW